MDKECRLMLAVVLGVFVTLLAVRVHSRPSWAAELASGRVAKVLHVQEAP